MRNLLTICLFSAKGLQKYLCYTLSLLETAWSVGEELHVLHSVCNQLANAKDSSFFLLFNSYSLLYRYRCHASLTLVPATWHVLATSMSTDTDLSIVLWECVPFFSACVILFPSPRDRYTQASLLEDKIHGAVMSLQKIMEATISLADAYLNLEQVSWSWQIWELHK